MSKKHVMIWVVVVFILVCSIGYGGYTYYHNEVYDKLLDKANSYMKNGEYKKAINTYEEVLKYKNDNKIEKNIKQAKEKLDENLKSKLKDKRENNSDKNGNYSNSGNTITKEKAVELTAEHYSTKDQNTKFVFDHEDVRDNETYYVIQVFDSMEDHSATMGWYYVNKKNGKVYEWDLGKNKLIPIS